MKEKNYDFRYRHWEVHKKNRRNSEYRATENELMLDTSWRLGCAEDAPAIVSDALLDFQDYLLKSMNLSLCLTKTRSERVLWMDVNPKIERGFVIKATSQGIDLVLSDAGMAFRAIVYLEDVMNLEGAPVLPLGEAARTPMYRYRNVHSGCGIDEFPDSELRATVHAGYDAIVLFVKGLEKTAAGYCRINDIIERATAFGLGVIFYGYMPSFKHPDEPDAESFFDSVYGELFRRYPGAMGIMLFGESLEFPSKDPATTGKRYNESVQDGIPDTRPSPGWYPCSDYPDYLAAIERAVHRVKPSAHIIFGTYNWGYAPLPERRTFLERVPKGITVNVTYEIFSKHRLEGLHTPIMDYTASVTEPGYYFRSESEAAHQLEIPLQGNVNTAGVSWSFGCVPYLPVPSLWLKRCLNLRSAQKNWGVDSHYCTHHYGWWNSVAADIGKWTSWKNFEPDYKQLLQKIAIRDYGKEAASDILKAWSSWENAMAYYVASNEDQYGPWRVGPAYPFIFHPNISRTLLSKEIRFPTAPQAHFGWKIIKTFYQPFENANQSPAFLRYPAELRSLEKMQQFWKQGNNFIQKALETSTSRNEQKSALNRLAALGNFISHAVQTTIHIKKWWLLNTALMNVTTSDEADTLLDQIEAIAHAEIQNAMETIPAVEADSRIGWEPSMEYVCDRWHLEWKIRQVNNALLEIATYRRMIRLHETPDHA